MTLIPVNSSAIAAIGYENGVLAVQFHGNPKIYDHPGVPDFVFTEFVQAESKGNYYNTKIRGRYQ